MLDEDELIANFEGLRKLPVSWYVIDPVKIKEMLYYIKQINTVNDNFSLVCLFNTNETRLIDLSEREEKFRSVNEGWASRISDFDYFKKVHMDSCGTLQWITSLILTLTLSMK